MELTLTGLGASQQTYTLPNGLAIRHHRAGETLHLYRDIFEDQVYLRHGISLLPHAVVVDAGANIGLFSLFVLTVCPTASIYAFEPAPKSFQLLKANTAARADQVKLYQCGLGAGEQMARFTYLPKITCGSGFYTNNDIEQRKHTIQSLIMSIPENRAAFDGDVGQELLQYYVEEAFHGEVFDVPVMPVSKIILEEQIEYVDLLKVDVEGRERDLLRGIQERHWPKIKQVVLEVHDSPNALPEIVADLQRHGFRVTAVPEENAGEISGITMAYATRA